MPLVVGIWLVAEVGLAAADGLSMLATLSDPCATRGAKLAGVGFFAMGAAGPGGGYGTAAKGATAFDPSIPQHMVRHSFEKHVLNQKNFPGWIRTTKQLEDHAARVLTEGISKQLGNGRVAYWHDSTSTVAIWNTLKPHRSTIFQPDRNRGYFDDLEEWRR